MTEESQNEEGHIDLDYEDLEHMSRRDLMELLDSYHDLIHRVERLHKAWKILRSKTEMSCVCFAEYPDKQDINTHELMDLAMKEASE